MRYFNQFFIIVFGVFCSVKALAFEKVSVGSTMYNACKSLHVHEKPTAFSKKVKTIIFGKQIEVKGLENLLKCKTGHIKVLLASNKLFRNLRYFRNVIRWYFFQNLKLFRKREKNA